MSRHSMAAIDTELNTLNEIYCSLEAVLNAPGPDSDEYPRLSAITEQAARIVAGMQVTSKVPVADISSSCAQLHRILDLAGKRAEELRRIQSETRKQIAALNTGGHFLQSIQRYRENHPKFIDRRH